MVCMHLLEREPLLAVLQDALATAQSGVGRMVLVGGEAGIGKTALVTVFARQHAQAVRLLWGACDALFSPRPLGPLYEVAEQLGGAWPTRLEASEKPADLFGALQTELNQRPTLVVIEDAHWADEATLDLLRYLARRMTRTQLLIVITYRDDELAPGHPLRAMLGDLATVSGIVRVAPARLSLAAVQELAGSAVDAEALHARTLGNPFYVTEVLADPTGHLPASVRDAVLSRIARLSLSGQAVVQAAAIIGPCAETPVLSAVAGTDIVALGECLHAGVLTASEAGLAFRHDIVRQAVLQSITPTQRLVLHRLTLEVLKTTAGLNRNLARLAHHAEAAADPAAILTFAPAAATVARDAGAHRAAATLLELALDHAEGLPPGERAELLERLATEYDTLDRRPEAIDMRRRALGAWRRADQPHKLGRSLAQFALLLQITGHKDEAERANHEALEILEPLPPTPELLSAYNMAAWLSLGANDNARGAAQAEKGIRLAETLGAEQELPRLLEVAGLCWLYLDLERGLGYLNEALALSLRLDHNVRAGNLYANLSSIHVDFHDFARAEALFSVGLPFAAERDLNSVRAYMIGYLAIHQMHQGAWGQADETIRQALGADSLSPGRGPALIALGRLCARRGQPGADDALEEALDLLLKQGFRQREGAIRAARAEAAWLAGDRERVLAEASAAYDLAFSHRQAWYVGELAYWLWQAGAPAADLPAWTAEPYARHLGGDWRGAAEVWRRLGCPYEQARALADGDAEAQAAALLIFDRLGARPAAEALRARLQAAGAPIPRGPRGTTRANPYGLTARQVEILRLLGQRLTNSQIAERLVLSSKTVDNHVSALFAKLGVSSREEAAERAKDL